MSSVKCLITGEFSTCIFCQGGIISNSIVNFTWNSNAVRGKLQWCTEYLSITLLFSTFQRLIF